MYYLNFQLLFFCCFSHRLTLAALGLKLNDYWREKKEKKAKERAFQALERKSHEGDTEETEEEDGEEEEEEEEVYDFFPPKLFTQQCCGTWFALLMIC